jgi:hypothetical protein
MLGIGGDTDLTRGQPPRAQLPRIENKHRERVHLKCQETQRVSGMPRQLPEAAGQYV